MILNLANSTKGREKEADHPPRIVLTEEEREKIGREEEMMTTIAPERRIEGIRHQARNLAVDTRIEDVMTAGREAVGAVPQLKVKEDITVDP